MSKFLKTIISLCYDKLINSIEYIQHSNEPLYMILCVHILIHVLHDISLGSSLPRSFPCCYNQIIIVTSIVTNLQSNFIISENVILLPHVVQHKETVVINRAVSKKSNCMYMC